MDTAFPRRASLILAASALAFTAFADSDAATTPDTAPATATATAADAPAVFTQAHAERGAEAYAASCAACHGAELEGIAHFPSLAGADFLARWEGRSAGELYAYIRANMPLGAGGSLSDDTYLDIVAALLLENGFPVAEEAELTPEALDAVPLAPTSEAGAAAGG